MTTSINRRRFLSASAAGLVGAGAALRPRPAAAQATAPSDRVRVAVIGTGRQARSLLRGFGRVAGVEIAALCDVFEPNLTEAAALAPSADTVKDFRRILDRKDVDAVVIATPDHWHALQTVMACQAGKDVYVEKPTSVAVAEGRAMVQAARKYSRVVQVGTQQRSQPHFARAVELVRSGKLGAIAMVRSWNVGNSAPDGIGNPPDGNPPVGLDWDLWLGPAPKVPFNSNRFGVNPNGWSTFRYFWDYAGGMMTDWGVHLIDIVQWAMDVEGPERVAAVGGRLALKDNRETPDTILASYQYKGFTLTYEHRAGNARGINGHGYGIEFYGTEGTLFVDREGFAVVPEERRVGEKREPRMDTAFEAAPPADERPPAHPQNFVDCVRSRQTPICDVEIGHRSSTTAILGNLAYRSGASLTWNARTETIPDNRAAAALLAKPYRKPWAL